MKTQSQGVKPMTLLKTVAAAGCSLALLTLTPASQAETEVCVDRKIGGCLDLILIEICGEISGEICVSLPSSGDI